MDPVRRGPDSFRRLWRAQVYSRQVDLSRPLGARELAAPEWSGSVRELIGAKITTFVPPQLPIEEGDLSCTRALVEYRRSSGYSGGFTLAAEMRTALTTPVVFIIGFATNVDRRWACIIGGLNFESNSWVTSKSNVGVFHGIGGSAWLGQHHDSARQQGLTFRLHWSSNTKEKLTDFVNHWAGKFGGGRLGRMLGLLDLDDDPYMQQGPSVDTQVVSGDDATYSFRTRLLFE
jgi:hypothetical protein